VLHKDKMTGKKQHQLLTLLLQNSKRDGGVTQGSDDRKETGSASIVTSKLYGVDAEVRTV
jgi:hypothetical protein